MIEHDVIRDGDEVYCKLCGCRWNVNEAAPNECDEPKAYLVKAFGTNVACLGYAKRPGDLVQLVAKHWPAHADIAIDRLAAMDSYVKSYRVPYMDYNPDNLSRATYETGDQVINPLKLRIIE